MTREPSGWALALEWEQVPTGPCCNYYLFILVNVQQFDWQNN